MRDISAHQYRHMGYHRGTSPVKSPHKPSQEPLLDGNPIIAWRLGALLRSAASPLDRCLGSGHWRSSLNTGVRLLRSSAWTLCRLGLVSLDLLLGRATAFLARAGRDRRSLASRRQSHRRVWKRRSRDLAQARSVGSGRVHLLLRTASLLGRRIDRRRRSRWRNVRRPRRSVRSCHTRASLSGRCILR